jgi:hypothetical protein
MIDGIIDRLNEEYYGKEKILKGQTMYVMF